MDSNYNPCNSLSYQNDSPQGQSEDSGIKLSKADSKLPEKKNRVRFTPGGESLDDKNVRAVFDVQEGVSNPLAVKEAIEPPLPRPRIDPVYSARASSSSLPVLPQSRSLDIIQPAPSSMIEVRPSAMRLSSADVELLEKGLLRKGPYDKADEADEHAARKATSQRFAQRQAERLSRRVGSQSAPSSAPGSPPWLAQPLDLEDIPLEKLEKRKKYGLYDDADDEAESGEAKKTILDTAKQLVTSIYPRQEFKEIASASRLRSGQTTPRPGHEQGDSYIDIPEQLRDGLLTSILRLYDEQVLARDTDVISPLPSGQSTPKGEHRNRAQKKYEPSTSGQSSPGIKHQKWYRNSNPSSTGSIESLDVASARPTSTIPQKIVRTLKHAVPTKVDKPNDRHLIQKNIAETLMRQSYLLKLSKALIMYGAPTHRLEEYMRTSAEILHIPGQFLYIPGSMIISFDDVATHTTEFRLIRDQHGLDLSKLKDLHEIYKTVMHSRMDVEVALGDLDQLLIRPPLYRPWLLVLVYGLASACVGPFAFGARPIDLPIAFLLGVLLGIMHLILAPKSDLYSKIFEVSAAALTSFLARVFGTIGDGKVFCFSALAQSAIALILPGYIVLCASLELQSRNLVAGSVRMVYALIYSLFLGFGITIGTTLYGAMDKNATAAVTCTGNNMPEWYPFLFVPPFTCCLIIINNGTWKQMPLMLTIALAGYTVSYFSGRFFASNAQIANTFGAFTVGLIGNLYSRCYHGGAAIAVLPAIFVQVPSGLAASGSLVSGVMSAMQITHQSVNGTVVNSTTTVSDAVQAGTGGVDVNTMVFNVGYSMIQISIGITVGLCLSTLLIYPFVINKRSGYFGF